MKYTTYDPPYPHDSLFENPQGDGPRYIPVTKWNDYHVWPPIGGLRHLIFHAKTNGFDKVVVRSGRRVLIDENAFFEWMRNKKQPSSGPPFSGYQI